MTGTNGHGAVDQLEEVAVPAEGGSTGQIVLDPDLLNSRDMLCARVALGGRNPYEVLDDPLERVPLIVWCLVTRTDPAFTWDQALDMPFSRLQFGGTDEPDPQTAPPGSPGRGAATKPASTSSKRRRAAASARS
jgi:hypothetical protein